MLIDEGCRDLRRSRRSPRYADGIVIKLSKCGGIREALRMIHAARALELKVMLGCMIESELGIAQAAQLGSLADYIDLDGHLLISSQPFAGLGLAGRAARALRAARAWAWSRPVADRLALFTGGSSRTRTPRPRTGSCATATREVVAVVDAAAAGRRRVATSCPYARRPVPIVAGVAEAVALGANVLVIGVAPFGGALTAEWRAALLEAIAAGMHVEAGLHTVLVGGPGARRRRRPRAGVELRDLRAAPPGLSVPPGRRERPDVRVVHTVGSDCAIGKMSVTLELDAAARARGLESAFVATGQTGIAISGWGIAVDHVISDFVAGAAARLVDEGAARAPLLFVEGQGALGHPAYSGVTLGLLHGCLPDALVLCHRAGATRHRRLPGDADPAAARAGRALRGRGRLGAAGARGRRSRSTRAGWTTTRRARRSTRRARRPGCPATDPVRFGAEPILDAVV